MGFVQEMLTALLLLAPGAFAAPFGGSLDSERSAAHIFARGGNQCKTYPTINSDCLSNIKYYSGYQSQPYKAKNSNSWSCGYGHTCKYRECKNENIKFPLSKNDAEYLLKNDLKPIQRCVAESISDKVKLNDNQFGALVSAAHSLGGCESFKRSSLCQKLNGLGSKSSYSDVTKICSEHLSKWYSASGKGSNQKRCNAEIALSKKSGQSCLPCQKNGKGSGFPNKGGDKKADKHDDPWQSGSNKKDDKDDDHWKDNDKKDSKQDNDKKDSKNDDDDWKGQKDGHGGGK